MFGFRLFEVRAEEDGPAEGGVCAGGVGGEEGGGGDGIVEEGVGVEEGGVDVGVGE